MPARLLALFVAGAATTLCGCGTNGVSSHCRNLPPVPRIGTSGFVTASPLPDISGYRVRFRSRDWQAGGLASHPTPFVGTAIVISASPAPAIRISPPTGAPLELPVLPLACA